MILFRSRDDAKQIRVSNGSSLTPHSRISRHVGGWRVSLTATILWWWLW